MSTLTVRIPGRNVGKRVVLLAAMLAAAIAPAAAQTDANLILNGDFEVHTGTGCQYNQSNASFGQMMSNAAAFGLSDEIDVMDGICYGPAAISGVTKLGLHTKATSERDELSLQLSTPLVAGAAYSLSYWLMSETSFSPALSTLEIGVSNSPLAFGTAVHSGTNTVPMVWTQFSTVFVAPHAAAYLTVSSGPELNCWAHVDGIVLDSACSCAPPTYCTAKLNSLGCVPAIGSQGCPSASAGSGFHLRATQVLNNKVGVLIYGVNGRIVTPFQGGWLCVKSPLRRTPPGNSGGNPPPNDCSGVFSIDMSAFASGALGGSPLPELSVPGMQVNCQWWGRDPGFPAPLGTSLSAGLEYIVCP